MTAKTGAAAVGMGHRVAALARIAETALAAAAGSLCRAAAWFPVPAARLAVAGPWFAVACASPVASGRSPAPGRSRSPPGRSRSPSPARSPPPGRSLALVDLPDFGTPLRRIAGSVERLAGLPAGEGAKAAELAEEANREAAKTKHGEPAAHA